MAPPLPARVLLVRLGAIGDVVNASLVANALRDNAGASVRIGWIAHELSAPLLAGHPCVDRLHVWRRASGWGGLKVVLAELREEGYDLCINLQRTAKAGLVARGSGAARVLGFDRRRTRELAWVWSTERLARAAPGRHMVDWYLDFVSHLGLEVPRPMWRFPADPAAERTAREWLSQLPHAPVLLHLGASAPAKVWPAERFGELAGRIGRELGRAVALTGGPADRGAAQTALRAAGDAPCLDLVGATSLMQFLALARGARLFVGGDTGPMHLAAAIGTRVVALFGPGDARRTGPYPGPRDGAAPIGHVVLQSPSRSLGDLSVDSVFQAVHASLADAPGI